MKIVKICLKFEFVNKNSTRIKYLERYENCIRVEVTSKIKIISVLESRPRVEVLLGFSLGARLS